MLPRALQQTRDRLCSVVRTVAIGEPIEYVEA
jgi:putative redox protein